MLKKKYILIILVTIFFILLICSVLTGRFSKVEVGTINYRDGHQYEGEIKKILFVIRLPHGQGKYTYEDDDTDIDRMIEDSGDAINVEAILKYENTFSKGMYEGEWKNGYKHGWGKALFPMHGIYVGEWEYSLRQGWGVETYLYYDIFNDYEYILEDIYIHFEGHWEKDYPHGQGTALYSDGSKYIGEWKYGVRHGQGTILYSDGTKYVGKWKDGYKHGEGVIIYPDGTNEEGIWYEGEKSETKVKGDMN